MICGLCKREINTKKEKYVHVEDWDSEKLMKDIWMHLSCFEKSMNRDLNEMEKQAKELISKGLPMIQRFKEILPKKEEEYIIN